MSSQSTLPVKTPISPARKIALQMLILTKIGKSNSMECALLISALPQPLKELVTEELKNMVDMTLDELNITLNLKKI